MSHQVLKTVALCTYAGFQPSVLRHWSTPSSTRSVLFKYCPRVYQSLTQLILHVRPRSTVVHVLGGLMCAMWRHAHSDSVPSIHVNFVCDVADCW